MSKSKGNYIGITEPPKVMFRKVMGISDDLMWRYWELLTDLSLSEIAALKQREPMSVKMELARRIVADFHSAAEAKQAEEDFSREVQQGGVPSDIGNIELRFGDGIALRDGITDAMKTHVPRVLVAAGLASSRTEAERLLKAGAVEINGQRWTEVLYPGVEFTVRAGKKWKKVIAG